MIQLYGVLKGSIRFSSYGEVTTTLFSIFFIIVLIFLMTLAYRLLRQPVDTLNHLDYYRRYGSLYTDLKTERKLFLAYSFLFFVR